MDRLHFLVFLALSITFLCFGCGIPDFESRWDAVVHHNFFCPEIEAPDSTAREYYEDGSLFSEISFRDGQIVGVSRFFHENGQLMRQTHYCHGRPHGPHITYFDDGQIDSRGYYYQGEMTGRWVYYFPDGELRELVVFSRNLEHGPFEEYHEGGYLKARGFYLQGENEHGLLYLYREDGTLKRTMRCNKGICRTIFNE